MYWNWKHKFWCPDVEGNEMEFLYFHSTDEWMGGRRFVGNKEVWGNYCQEIHCCVLLLLAYLILWSQQIYKIVFPFLSNIDHHLIYILFYSHSNIFHVFYNSVYIKIPKELLLSILYYFMFYIEFKFIGYTKSTNLLQIWIILFTRIFKYH